MQTGFCDYWRSSPGLIKSELNCRSCDPDGEKEFGGSVILFKKCKDMDSSYYILHNHVA